MQITDYGNKENWLSLPEVTKNVDTIYIYPTMYIDPSPDAPEHSAIDTPMMRRNAAVNFKKMASVYEKATNVFAPFYRQENLAAVVGMKQEDFEPFEEQVSDLFGSLDYYFEHLNGGRPFIMAGHSQGSSMLKDVIMNRYFKEHTDYYKRMIACYAIGFGFPKEYFSENPHLKFAEGETDTGVIISWNTEGVGNKDAYNVVVLPHSLCINPLNWKRDETYASADENRGSVFYNEETDAYDGFVPGVADARIDLSRGTLICEHNSQAEKYPFVPSAGMTGALFGPESYHTWDYAFYYRNLQENVDKRIASYFA